MAIDPFIEQPEPGPGEGHDEAVLEVQASAALERWLQDHPDVDRAKWAAALERAVRQLFPVQ